MSDMNTPGDTVHICGASDDLVEIAAPGFVERGTAQITLAPATDPEGSWPEYTDQVTIGPVTWIERLDTPDTDGDEAPVSRWEI